MKYIKTILLWFVLALPIYSHAGFIAGVVVGSALSSNSSNTVTTSKQGTVITSDKYDTVVCKSDPEDPSFCIHSRLREGLLKDCFEKLVGRKFNNYDEMNHRSDEFIRCQKSQSSKVTPILFIKEFGYKQIVKSSVYIDGGEVFSVFEVVK